MRFFWNIHKGGGGGGWVGGGGGCVNLCFQMLVKYMFISVMVVDGKP